MQIYIANDLIQETIWNGNSFGFAFGRHQNHSLKLHKTKDWD